MITSPFLSLENTEKKTLQKAAVLTKPRHFKFEEVYLREPKDMEICVKLEGCGLCASSLPVWEGREWFEYPNKAGNPGHEGWGIVYEVGYNVTRFKKGDRVAILSNHAFAEYDFALENAVVKIPEHLKHIPFPGEALGCAANIFNRSDIQRGQVVAIIGTGFLGTLMVQMAKAAGANVIAISRRESSRMLAKSCGADMAIPMDDHYKIIETVKHLTNGKFCDRVIECTGKEWPLNLAGELCKERGKLIIAGYHQDGLRQVNIQLWNWKGLDVINAHEREAEKYTDGIVEAIHLIEQGIIQPEVLFTHTFPFEDINKAFETLEQAPDGFIKALITY